MSKTQESRCSPYGGFPQQEEQDTNLSNMTPSSHYPLESDCCDTSSKVNVDVALPIGEATDQYDFCCSGPIDESSLKDDNITQGNAELNERALYSGVQNSNSTEPIDDRCPGNIVMAAQLPQSEKRYIQGMQESKLQTVTAEVALTESESESYADSACDGEHSILIDLSSRRSLEMLEIGLLQSSAALEQSRSNDCFGCNSAEYAIDSDTMDENDDECVTDLSSSTDEQNAGKNRFEGGRHKNLPTVTSELNRVLRNSMIDDCDENIEFSTVLLHLLMVKVQSYEPDIYDYIKAIVATRKNTESECGTKMLLASAEIQLLRTYRWTQRKNYKDEKRPRGSGPRPSRFHAMSRKMCGASCARSMANYVDPTVRTCLCISYDEFGNRTQSQLSLAIQGGLLRNASRLALIIDIADIIVDLVLVSRLSNRGKHGYATLMACAVAAAIPVEICVKASLVKLMSDKPPDSDPESLLNFMFFFALTELIIFLIEDATSIFCWYQTSIFDPNETLALVNMYITVVSGIMAGIGLLYPTCRVVMEALQYHWRQRRRSNRHRRIRYRRRKSCWSRFIDIGTPIYYTILFISIVSLLGFWCYVALDIIQHETMNDQSVHTNNTVATCFGLGFVCSICGMGSFFHNWWYSVPDWDWYCKFMMHYVGLLLSVIKRCFSCVRGPTEIAVKDVTPV